MNNYFKVGIAVFIAALISAFVPYTQTLETNINASFLDVANQINYADNWKNWYMPFKTAFENDSTKYKITQNYEKKKFSVTANGKLMEAMFFGPTLIEITFDNNAKKTILLKALFYKNDKTKFVQISKTSVLNYCWLYLTNSKPTYNFGQSLKNYFDMPKLLYGFKIIKTGVIDTNFVTLSKVVIKQNTYKTAHSLQQLLITYAKKNNFKCLEYPFLSILPKSADSVTITNMLVITDKKIGYNNEVNYLKMPKEGNMLIGYFKGEYRKRGQLYNSMDKYIAKNGLTRVVNTFEKFLDKKLPKNDSSVVNMALYYPIY